MLRGSWRTVCAVAVVLLLGLGLAGTAAGAFDWSSDAPRLKPGTRPPKLDEKAEERLIELDKEFIANRTAGDRRLQVQHAGALRSRAARERHGLHRTRPSRGPATFNGAWTNQGPTPIGEITRSSARLAPMNGRIGALAIRPSTGRIILAAAQGGIWTHDPGSEAWTPRTSDLGTQAMGALTVAPSDDAVVYAGTGEGALSGDSYFGNGVLKSGDGGQTWAHVSGDYFEGVSISRIAVDPTNANHLYAAVLRGRGGARRVTVAPHSRYGLWESTDGGRTWTLRKAATEQNGATDVEIDPQNPRIVYASFWNDAIYKSTDGGRTFSPIMNFVGLENPQFTDTRFSFSISHPAPGGAGTLYTGFAWKDAAGEDQPSRVWKSTDGGASWQELPAGDDGPHGEDDAVENYCDIQCFYDNVIEADPNNPNVVFAAGQYGYDLSPPSGGVYRSDDGGQTWKNLGWDLHPDFHAFAWDPQRPGHVAIGNDGGVWSSDDLGGRPERSDPLSAADWDDLNAGGLTLGQFSSIATNPSFPDQARLWGGTQDNGTLRKSAVSNQWYDVTSGDGGQVLVDPTDWHYVYGTYFGVSPYRMTDGGDAFYTNQSITNGIDTDDRSEFYVPWVLNKRNPNQLFLGTYRLYRTDDAKAPAAGDVKWAPISPDLTTGCTGTAPNGARGCFLSAIGIGGGDAVYTGSLDGLVHLSTDAKVNDSPTWKRLRDRVLPNRPVATIAVDRSNYRTAYLGYNGFDAATPRKPGHVFKTTDAGATWDDITGNLPDTPVNSLILDPSFPNTLYAATDVGPFVTYDGGRHWGPMGTGIATISVWQIDLDPAHGTMAAGTHGRGAYLMKSSVAAPALVLSKADSGVPVGPGSEIRYTLTVDNIGSAPATGVTISDPIPHNTDLVSASGNGTQRRGTVTWTGLSIPAGGRAQVTLRVHITSKLSRRVHSIVDDGYRVTSAEGESAAGSPVITPIAPSYAVTLEPATQTGAAHVVRGTTYPLSVANEGYKEDSYALSVTSGFPATVLDATCTTPMSTTPTVAPGDTAKVCVKVTPPAGTPDGQTDTATVKATSVAAPSVSATATLKTIAVAVDTLLVDEDTNQPVDSQPAYKAALTAAGVPFGTWDLASQGEMPPNYLEAFANVVWFTGSSYPGPLLPYESRLKAFLDGGGHLLVSGQDILDQAAGTTPFVHDYLHITWDGSETQNDKPTAAVHGIAGTLTDGLGAVPLDHSVLQAAFEDQITPNGGATAVFTDDSGAADALSFAGGYKVVFLAFPLEAYGSAAERGDLVSRVMGFFGP